MRRSRTALALHRAWAFLAILCFCMHVAPPSSTSASVVTECGAPAAAIGGTEALCTGELHAAALTRTLAAAVAASEEAEAEAAAQRDRDICDIEKIPAASFGALPFFRRYFQRRPFILTNYSLTATAGSGRAPTEGLLSASSDLVHPRSFRARSSPAALLASHGHELVQAAAGSTYSHQRRSLLLREYMEQQRRNPLSLGAQADDTAYFFGDHDDPGQFGAKEWQQQAEAEKEEQQRSTETRCNITAAAGGSSGDKCSVDTPPVAPSPPSPSRPVWAKLLRHYPPPPFVLPHTLLAELRAEANAAAHADRSTPAPAAGGVEETVEGETETYAIPPLFDYLRYSFGLGGHRTGVPFHFHGAAIAEVLHGRKRWFLFPPKEFAPAAPTADASWESRAAPPPASSGASIPLPFPSFRPELTQLQWLARMYPSLSEAERPLQCTLAPGELLYVPPSWYHATTNLGEGEGGEQLSVFLSTFVDEGRMEGVMREFGVDVHALAVKDQQ